MSITFEQIINKYRVLFAAKDYQTALSLAIDSINCIVNNKPFKDVYKVEMKSIIEEGYTEYLQWADYIINSIIERIIHDKELSEFEKNNMIYHVFKNVEQVENKKFCYLNMAKQNIEYFIKNKKSEFIESSYNLSKNISSLPAGLQFFFLYSLDENNIINKKLHDEYIEKVLKRAV
ncbi:MULTISPECIES: hypothetical protein [unclassified Myroides]|uniref:hypothetical protein n=1 Tax=unclassified Myroides TaxID=2642485 RepID=UPI003D2F8F17